MFGMGFSEILIIAVIAILFLGPDKLPSTMVEIAKFFRSVKNTVGSVKESIEEEMHVADIKQEALAYKNELLNASTSLNNATNIDNLLSDDAPQEPKALKKEEPQKNQEVTFKKKKKKSIDV
jgi:sec-independent protein translocase protein TatB